MEAHLYNAHCQIKPSIQCETLSEKKNHQDSMVQHKNESIFIIVASMKAFNFMEK